MKKLPPLKQVRITKENYQQLVAARNASRVRVSLGALANAAISVGLEELKERKLLKENHAEMCERC